MQHHAYYIEGAQSQFETYKGELKPFYARQYEKFGIDEARELVALAGLKNFKEAVFFLGISAITTEAQQALLKLLEEPQEGTTFILLVPHGVLLPTVKSRMLEYKKSEIQNSKSETIIKFLKSSNKDRSDFIAKLLKEEDKEQVRDFINGLERELYEKGERKGLEDIAMVRDYLRDRSPSLKMLLEHLALSV